MEHKKVSDIELGDVVFYGYRALKVVGKAYNSGAFGDYYLLSFYDEYKEEFVKPVAFDFGARIALAVEMSVPSGTMKK